VSPELHGPFTLGASMQFHFLWQVDIRQLMRWLGGWVTSLGNSYSALRFTTDDLYPIWDKCNRQQD
jgi:hypothetical protein